MTRRTVIIIIAVAIMAAVLGQAAFASGQTYVDKRRVIRVGALLIRGQNPDFYPAPYTFFIMDQREDMKPQGWSFINPLAGGKDSFKNVARYWMVPLEQTTLENLAKFDVLYMNASGPVSFRMSERDKLRRFVDGGGCLWVDNGGGMRFPTTPAEGFFLPGVNFDTPNTAGKANLLARLHPLVTNPFWLTPDEVASVGLAGAKINPGFTGWIAGDLNSVPNPTLLCPLIECGGLTVGAVEYGSGRVLFTSGSVGGKIQGPVVAGTPASLNVWNSNLLRADPGSLRFAYNVVSWATSSTTLRKNYRRTGASLDGIGAPLVEKWSFNQGVTGSGDNGVAMWKNVVFHSSGGTLYALDANPEADLDMDGLSDDGWPDSGAPYDIIWQAPVGGQISSPTVASMLDPNDTAPKDFVFVTGSDGKVHVFEALSAIGNKLNPSPLERGDLWPDEAWKDPKRLFPPVVQNGWIYAVSDDGYIHGYSPVLMEAAGAKYGTPGGEWSCPLSSDPNRSATIKYGPTFGFIKNKTNGAVVQMLCVLADLPAPAGSPDVDGDGVPDDADGDCIFTLPVFVASDLLKPTSPITAPMSVPVVYRTSFGNLPISSYPKPEIWAVDAEGNSVSVNPLQPTDYNAVPGQVTVSGSLGPNVRVYLTYAIDYSSLPPPGVFPLKPYEIPPKMPTIGTTYSNPRASGTPVLGPNDTFYMGVDWGGNGAPGGATGRSSVYSMWYDGKTGILNWNYFLHGGWEVPNGKGDGQYWGVYVRRPGDTAPTPVKQLKAVGAPAVTTNRVFMTAESEAGTAGYGMAHLLCFKADPDFIIRVNRPLRDAATKRPLSVKIWQPDLLFSGGNTVDPLLSAVSVPRDMIDYDSGTITITDFNKIRQMSLIGGTMTASGTFTPSLPVWIYIDNSPVPPEELDLSNWDNLLWSFPVPNHGNDTCAGVSSSPVVLGDYVYFTCRDGYLFAVAIDATPKDKILDEADQNFENWVPMKMSTGASGGAAVSLAGSGGMLMVPDGAGLFAFNNPLNLITDNHRVLEVGGDGKVYWACDSVLEPKQATGVAGNHYGVHPQSLNKPTMAQKVGSSDYLVVESGSDRVIRMDRGGQVRWSLKRFEDSYKNLLRSGESKMLKAPVDARMWNEFENIDGDWFYMMHCMVVDSGNFRILDIVDRFRANANGQILEPVNPDSDGRPIHELNWVSHTSYKEKRLTFTSIQIVGGLEVWASASNYGMTGSGTPLTPGGGHLGGAIVKLKYREQLEAKTPFVWNYLDGTIAAELTSLTRGTEKVALSGPKFFEVRSAAEPKLLICDQSAVYLTYDPDGKIDWSFTAAEYATYQRSIGGDPGFQLNIPFQPERAQVLPGGERVLIVNGYAGRTQDPKLFKFTGEVFELDKTTSEIKWYTPEMHAVKDPDTGQVIEILQRMKNAPNLDQPTCVQRLF